MQPVLRLPAGRYGIAVRRNPKFLPTHQSLVIRFWIIKRACENLGTTCPFLEFNFYEPNKIQAKYYFLSYFPGG